MKDIRKATVWHDVTGEEYTFSEGRILEQKTQPHIMLKLPVVTAHNANFPKDLVDYCITVTAVDGTHYHSEITEYNQGNGNIKYKLPSPANGYLD